MLDSMKARFRRPSPVTAISTVALAGGAYAAIPGSGGAITGCYTTSNGLLLGIAYSKGDLRAIDATTDTCRSYEKPLMWNQQGPAGVTGPKGPLQPWHHPRRSRPNLARPSQ